MNHYPIILVGGPADGRREDVGDDDHLPIAWYVMVQPTFDPVRLARLPLESPIPIPERHYYVRTSGMRLFPDHTWAYVYSYKGET